MKTASRGEPMDATVLRELRAIVGADHVRHADGDVAACARDATPLFSARPEAIRTGGRLWKDVAGYNLTRLLTGSEGTPGVITEATVALTPTLETSGTGLAYLGARQMALLRRIKAAFDPAGILNPGKLGS
jgi:FAD/FMN-containing dehydrogenase